MRRALAAKELREHGPVLLGVGAFLTAIFGLLFVANAVQGEPPFVVLQRYLLFLLPIAAWILGGRLVRHEYVHGTQLFLESLPVSRSSVLAVKYAVGLAAMTAFSAPAWAACALATLRGHDLDAALLVAVGLRTAAWVWFLHATGFVLGFLGRFRAPLLIVALVGVALVGSKSDLEARDFGPLGLMDETFAFERGELPWGLLAGACGVAAAATAVSWLLASVREGSVAAQLAQQMSHRERAFAGVVVVACLTAIGAWEDKRTKAPFAPDAAAVAEGPGLRVVVGAESGLPAEGAEEFAASVHRRIDPLRADLGIVELAPVYLFSRTGLDARRYERGTVEDEAGVIARVNRRAAQWDEDHFVAWLARELVLDHTIGRAGRESRRWVLDGYGDLRARPGDDPTLLLRALHGAAGGVTESDLERWESFRDRVGPDVACAVAWSILRSLEASRGADATRAFLAAALGTEPPDDLRALGWEARHGIGALLERHAGTSVGELLREWTAWLGARRAEIPATEVVAVTSAALRVVPVTDASREVEFVAEVAGAPSPDARVRFQWAVLGPFDAIVEDADWESDDVAAADAAAGRRVPHAFRRGERIAWRVACRSAALACDVVTPVRRVVLE